MKDSKDSKETLRAYACIGTANWRFDINVRSSVRTPHERDPRGDDLLKRLGKPTKSMFVGAVVVLVGASAACAYWTNSGPGSGTAATGTGVADDDVAVTVLRDYLDSADLNMAIALLRRATLDLSTYAGAR